jgi:hypothetical protein
VSGGLDPGTFALAVGGWREGGGGSPYRTDSGGHNLPAPFNEPRRRVPNHVLDIVIELAASCQEGTQVGDSEERRRVYLPQPEAGRLQQDLVNA